MAFAITGGTFNTPSIWDTGVVPTGSEDAYANGFTIQVSGTVSCNTVRNDASNYYLVNTAIPLMTSNTTPSGIVTTTSQVAGLEAWKVFDRNTSTYWQTAGGVTSASITYQFSSTRIVKRYMWKASSTATAPRDFTFQGSNDGISFTTLDTQTAINVGANGIFTSSLLANTTPYLYYRLSITTNNGASAIVVTEFEMTESTSTSVGQIVGGTFNLLNGTNLTVTANTGVVVNSATAPVTFALNSPNSATINGNIISPAISTNQAAISHTGTGTLNMNGNHSNNSTGGRVIQVTSGGILNVSGSPNNGAIGISPTYDLSTTSSINITGNLINSGSFIIYHRGTGTVNVNGNVSAGSSNPTIGLVSSSNCVVSGNVTGISTVSAISNTGGAANINVTGAVTAGTGAPAIVGLGTVTLTGPLINTNGFMAVSAPRLFITSATTYWSFTSSSGSTRILYTDAPTNVSGFPSTTDVRIGTVYGPTNTTIGTMNVPLPSNVRIGVPTDNTIGTATLTAEDLFDAISGSTSGVGYRLKNIATVATVGKQIASFNI